MIFLIRLHILFCLILLVLCAPPPIYRGVALVSYLWYFRFFCTRYRLGIWGRQAAKPRPSPSARPARGPVVQLPVVATASDHRT
jgi:hypothetical protein